MQIEQKQNRIFKPQSVFTLSAEESNQITTELENLITEGGLTPSSGDLEQVKKAVNNIVDTSANNLQQQIDAITSASDVFDVVGTYAQLQSYDKTAVPVNDIIKVLQDETHNNAAAFYRLTESGGVKSWTYIGQEGPYYTKSEVDADFATKAELPGAATPLQIGLVKPDNVTLQVDANGTLSNTLPTLVADGVTIENNSGALSAVAVKDQRTTNAIKVWAGTKAQYESITPKDDNTIYNVTDETSYAQGAYVVETYHNGADWYRVWSDGWCEQGGSAPAGTMVQFLKPFKDTNFSVICTPNGGTNPGSATTIAFYNKTIANVSFTTANNSTPVVWEAKGYIF